MRTSARTRRSSASIATVVSPSTSRCRRRMSGTSTTAISYDIGGIHDPMGNAFHTALTAEIPGATVLITGCGPIGIFAVGICRAAGASRIIASDINPKRLELAKHDGRARCRHTPAGRSCRESRDRRAWRRRRARDVRRSRGDPPGARARESRRARAACSAFRRSRSSSIFRRK